MTVCLCTKELEVGGRRGVGGGKEEGGGGGGRGGGSIYLLSVHLARYRITLHSFRILPYGMLLTVCDVMQYLTDT